MKEPKPKKWVFIVGCYNSGTTLLHQILAQHPAIGSLPNEGQFFTDQFLTGAKVGLRRQWALKPELFYLDENSEAGIDVGKVKREWAYFFNDAKRPLLLEKTIAHTARMRWLERHFQEAYFIAIYRNGYAVAEGIHRKEHHKIEDAILQWKVSNEIVVKESTQLQHFHAVHYEELTANPTAAVKKITDFLGIDPVPESAFSSEFKIHKVDAKITNMNDKSFKNLKPEEIKVMNEMAGDLMKQLGYPLL
ncbi:hypothetical protein BH11BAC2_BH11BAC2_24740 [soil metagenome]